MILLDKFYRETKSILLKLPGAPSSSRMAEFMAASWGFRDHQELRAYFENIETCAALPEHFDSDDEAGLAKLAEFGCQGWPAKDILATFLALNDGDLLWEMMDEYPLLEGAAVLRFDQTTDRWKDSMEASWKRHSKALGINRVILDLSSMPGWRQQIEFPDIGRHISVINETATDNCMELNEDQFEADRQISDAGHPSLYDMMENILMMCREALPKGETDPEPYEDDPDPEKDANAAMSKMVQALIVSHDGIWSYCHHYQNDVGAPVWLAIFEDGKITRRKSSMPR
ncbi:hypothetical protein KUV57_11970 [Epibacterium sp. DP7N7-1]|nr:hypothetical protein [Epibacterium sp. DP7N7-1]